MENKKQQHIQEAIKELLRRFQTGEIAGLIHTAMIQRHPDDIRPMDKWSMGNRILCLLAGTTDARGIKQWASVGRRVKRGSKAFYILVPRLKTITEVDEDTGEENEVSALRGFSASPVFCVQDTEGRPTEQEGRELPRVDYRPPQQPPLAEVAERFGVRVEYHGYSGGIAEGSYSPTTQTIQLYTHDSHVFWHELSHAAHDRLLQAKGETLRNRCKEEREAVAELSATVLAMFYGKDYSGNCWRYLQQVIKDKNPLGVMFRVLSEVEGTVGMVFTEPRRQNVQKA